MAKPKRKKEFDEVRKALAFDEAIAKLNEAGIASQFVAAVQKDASLRASLSKMAPKLSAAASPGWSCCITVSNPLRSKAGPVVNPATRARS
ncbi:MAG: hypothetical protein ACHQKZ_02315 [Solirubrobacterales bacterium]